MMHFERATHEVRPAPTDINREPADIKCETADIKPETPDIARATKDINPARLGLASAPLHAHSAHVGVDVAPHDTKIPPIQDKSPHLEVPRATDHRNFPNLEMKTTIVDSLRRSHLITSVDIRIVNPILDIPLALDEICLVAHHMKGASARLASPPDEINGATDHTAPPTDRRNLETDDMKAPPSRPRVGVPRQWRRFDVQRGRYRPRRPGRDA